MPKKTETTNTYENVKAIYQGLYTRWCSGDAPSISEWNNLVSKIEKATPYILAIEHRQNIIEWNRFAYTRGRKGKEKVRVVDLSEILLKGPLTTLKHSSLNSSRTL